MPNLGATCLYARWFICPVIWSNLNGSRGRIKTIYSLLGFFVFSLVYTFLVFLAAGGERLLT